MKVWKMVKNRLPFFGTRPLLADVAGAIRTMASSGRPRSVGLVGQDAIGQEQNARPAGRRAARIPAAVKELPGDLKGDAGLARAGGEVGRMRWRFAAIAAITRSTAMSW